MDFSKILFDAAQKYSYTSWSLFSVLNTHILIQTEQLNQNLSVLPKYQRHVVCVTHNKMCENEDEATGMLEALVKYQATRKWVKFISPSGPWKEIHLVPK